MGGAHGCAAGSRRAKLLPVRQAHGERRSCVSGWLMMEEDAPCQYGLSLMRQVHVGRSIVNDAGASSRGGQPVLAGLSALSAPLYGRAVPGPCVTWCMGWFVGTGSQIKSMCSGGHYLTGICTKFNLPGGQLLISNYVLCSQTAICRICPPMGLYLYTR